MKSARTLCVIALSLAAASLALYGLKGRSGLAGILGVKLPADAHILNIYVERSLDYGFVRGMAKLQLRSDGWPEFARILKLSTNAAGPLATESLPANVNEWWIPRNADQRVLGEFTSLDWERQIRVLKMDNIVYLEFSGLTPIIRK